MLPHLKVIYKTSENYFYNKINITISMRWLDGVIRRTTNAMEKRQKTKMMYTALHIKLDIEPPEPRGLNSDAPEG